MLMMTELMLSFSIHTHLKGASSENEADPPTRPCASSIPQPAQQSRQARKRHAAQRPSVPLCLLFSAGSAGSRPHLSWGLGLSTLISPAPGPQPQATPTRGQGPDGYLRPRGQGLCSQPAGQRPTPLPPTPSLPEEAPWPFRKDSLFPFPRPRLHSHTSLSTLPPQLSQSAPFPHLLPWTCVAHSVPTGMTAVSSLRSVLLPEVPPPPQSRTAFTPCPAHLTCPSQKNAGSGPGAGWGLSSAPLAGSRRCPFWASGHQLTPQASDCLKSTIRLSNWLRMSTPCF